MRQNLLDNPVALQASSKSAQEMSDAEVATAYWNRSMDVARERARHIDYFSSHFDLLSAQ